MRKKSAIVFCAISCHNNFTEEKCFDNMKQDEEKWTKIKKVVLFKPM